MANESSGIDKLCHGISTQKMCPYPIQSFRRTVSIGAAMVRFG